MKEMSDAEVLKVLGPQLTDARRALVQRARALIRQRHPATGGSAEAHLENIAVARDLLEEHGVKPESVICGHCRGMGTLLRLDGAPTVVYGFVGVVTQSASGANSVYPERCPRCRGFGYLGHIPCMLSGDAAL